MFKEALCNYLSVEHVIEVLIQADRHWAEQLKAQAIKFINNRVSTTSIIDKFDGLGLKLFSSMPVGLDQNFTYIFHTEIVAKGLFKHDF